MFLVRSPRRRTTELMPSVMRVLLVALLLCGVMAGAAQARIWVGVGIPLFVPPVVVGPPAYYPPYYYGPPGGYPPAGNTFSYTPGAQPQSLAPPNGYGPQGGYPPPPGYAPGYPPPPGYAPGYPPPQ